MQPTCNFDAGPILRPRRLACRIRGVQGEVLQDGAPKLLLHLGDGDAGRDALHQAVIRARRQDPSARNHGGEPSHSELWPRIPIKAAEAQLVPHVACALSLLLSFSAAAVPGGAKPRPLQVAAPGALTKDLEVAQPP